MAGKKTNNLIIGNVNLDLVDDEARDLIDALKSDVKTDIAGVRSDVNAEIADVNAEIADVRSDVTGDIATVDARMDNLVTNINGAEVTTLWTGSISKKGDSATLSQNVSNFDFIDIYMLSGADTKFFRIPKTQTSLQIQQQNMSDDGSSNFIRMWETGVTISGKTVSINKVIAWFWDDPNNAHPTVAANADTGDAITRIDGVRSSASVNAELADVRVGVDGTTYTSAGAAVRGQISDVKEDINEIFTFDTQFVDMSAALSNKRYEVTSVNVIDGNGYFAIPKLSLKAGTYYFADLVANFCHYIYSGQSTINNFSGSGKISGSITFDSNVDVYLTGNTSYGNIMFANDILPDSYIYGNYNFSLKDDLVVIDIDDNLTKSNVSADAKATGNALGVNGYQYVDESKIVENYRYGTDGSKTPVASTGYFILPAIALKAGKYYFRNIYTDFTTIENAETNATVSLKTFVGSGRISGSVTIDYDFNVYITGNLSFDNLAYGKVVWADYPINSLGNDRVYGIFGIRADSRRYQEKVKPVFTVEKDGTGDFTTIKSALETAVLYSNAIVKVGTGTFDLIEEFGSDYFANLGAVGNSGLQLYNDITVEFTSDTLVTCHYAGTNSNVMIYFSPFNLNQDTGNKGGFTLKNLHLECSNVRYGVHDESNATDKPYRNEYLNCVIRVDNRENTAFSARQCIGGGLGSASEIIIHDCIFESLTNEGTAGTGIVSYHNGGTGRSDIVIRDCYFKGKDTVKASWHGTSTKVSTMTVSGCSMGSTPYNQAESSGDTVENMELITWNNDIRS